MDLEGYCVGYLLAMVGKLNDIEVVKVVGDLGARIVGPVAWKILISPQVSVEEVTLLQNIKLHQDCHRVNEKLEERLGHVLCLVFSEL